jgi:hypothetical protein
LEDNLASAGTTVASAKAKREKLQMRYAMFMKALLRVADLLT